MQPQLSIVTLTMPDRQKRFKTLKAVIDKQIKYMREVHLSLGSIEHVVVAEQTKKTIGYRRNLGLNRAKGKYIAFIDDDDMISLEYVESLVRKTYEDKDAVLFDYLLFNQGMVTDLQADLNAKHNPSLSSDSYVNNTGVWHTSAIRADIAKQGEFTDGNWNEDINYLEVVRPLIKNVTCVNKFLYFYLKDWRVEPII